MRQSINIANDVNEKYDQIIKNEQGIADSQTKLKGFQAQIDSALTTAKQSEEKIKELETSSIGFVSKINELLNKSNELKAEISNIYDKIFGYDTKDENTGEIHHEEGLNDELNKSYKELRDQQNKLAKDTLSFFPMEFFVYCISIILINLRTWLFLNIVLTEFLFLNY